METLARPPPRRRLLVQALLRSAFSRPALCFIAGGVVVSVLRKLHEMWHRVRKAHAEFLWRRHVDFSVVQACVLSAEHLQSLGRVEKRTLFVKPISEVFRNEYILSRVLEAAEKAAMSKDPMLMIHLSPEDKWHVLNTCSNHISSCFAPYHVFFNEARRTKSYYKSAWYCFTLTCAQTEACGRWFITPYKPVGAGDCGSLRIRMVLANEQELREIAAGVLEAPPPGMFNGRHESRWQVFQRFADLFARQLARSAEDEEKVRSNGKLSKKKKVASSVRLGVLDAQEVPDYEPEDNSILRIHIPFPSSANRPEVDESAETPDASESAAKDVILFE